MNSHNHIIAIIFCAFNKSTSDSGMRPVPRKISLGRNSVRLPAVQTAASPRHTMIVGVRVAVVRVQECSKLGDISGDVPRLL